jgi:hypothetical protein
VDIVGKKWMVLGNSGRCREIVDIVGKKWCKSGKTCRLHGNFCSITTDGTRDSSCHNHVITKMVKTTPSLGAPRGQLARPYQSLCFSHPTAPSKSLYLPSISRERSGPRARALMNSHTCILTQTHTDTHTHTHTHTHSDTLHTHTHTHTHTDTHTLTHTPDTHTHTHTHTHTDTRVCSSARAGTSGRQKSSSTPAERTWMRRRRARCWLAIWTATW